MRYSDIANQSDHLQACREYITERYGESVMLQLPATVDTLYRAVLSGATEELAQLHILSDHRLPVPEKK
jgi:SLT domain-containing protein